MVTIFTNVTVIHYFMFEKQDHTAGYLTKERAVRFIPGLLWKV